MKNQWTRMLVGAVACLAVALPARPCLAGFAGSLHDWVGGPNAVIPLYRPSLVPNGPCTACHIPHKGANARIWSRSLDQERALGKYVQTGTPNYLPGGTLLCYDCHDDGSWADLSPNPEVWKQGYGPKDIALQGHGNGSANVGYYELIDGNLPSAGTPPIDGSATGGHYWKSNWNGVLGKGDKIDCSFCHDVHNAGTGTNMVFFRRYVLGQDLLEGHVASDNTRSGALKEGPDSGRSMCAACHAYSDSATPPKTFLGVVLPRPTGTIAQHADDDTTTPCTNCHKHNKIVVSCTTCHGNPPASGAHQKHTDYLSGTSCDYCHGPNAAALPSHNTGTVDWNPGLTYSEAANRGNVTGTCSGAAACHDAPSNIAWSAAPTNCNQCHLNAADTDVNDFNHNNGTASRIDNSEFTSVGHGLTGAGNPNKGCMDCHDITTTSHDNSTNLFRLKDLDGNGGNGLDFSCSYNAASCHPAGTNTDLGIDYQSIKTHSAAEMTAAGYDPKYDGAAGGWGFAPACVNCHDPHGDGANISMIQKELYDKAAFLLPTQTPPAAPTEQTALEFTNNTAGVHANGTSYADADAPFSSICQECHEGATPGTDTTYAFVDGVSATAGNHSMNTDCSACHTHDSGFKPSGCSGCHGGGTTVDTVKNYWPDDSNVNTENDAGRHLKHVEELAKRLFGETTTELLTDDSGTPGGGSLSSDAKQKRTCAYCHEDPAGVNFAGPTAFNHNNGTANVTTPSVFIRQMWQPYSTDFDTADTNAAYDKVADTCATVDCHNNKLTTDATYGWYDAGTSACVMCHTPGGTGSDPVSGLHTGTPTVSGVTHDEAFATSGGCTSCHASLPARTTTSTHQNGSFEANGTVAGNKTAMGLFADYTAASTANDGTGTCSGGTVGASGCHGKGDGGTWKREWDSVLPYDTLASLSPCKGCHGAAAADFTFGATHNATDGQTEHTYNWDGDGTGPEIMSDGTHNGCKVCHGVNSVSDKRASYTSGAYFWYSRDGNTGMHGDGSIQMNGPAPSTGTGYDQTNWGCSNAAACHANDWTGGTYPDGSGHRLDDSNWDIATVDFGGATCSNCHGGGLSGYGNQNVWPDSATNGNLYENRAGAHQKHVNAVYAQHQNSTILAGLTEVEEKNDTCDWCHPGGQHSGDQAGAPADLMAPPATRFRKMDGVDDSDTATYSAATEKCSNISCHGALTPAWYGGADTTPPTVANLRVNGSTTPISIQQGTATVTLTAEASDTQSLISAGGYFDNVTPVHGNGTAMTAQDPPFDSSSETLTAVLDSKEWPTGTRWLYVDAKDGSNIWGPVPATTAGISLTVTAPDGFTVAASSTAVTVTPAQTNVLMQTLTVSVTGGAIDLTALEVTGTQSAGSPGEVAIDVSAVKIFKDSGGGGDVAGTFQPGTDTPIGTGSFLDTGTRKAAIDISDQTGISGTFYLYVVYDLTTGATDGDVIGAQLSGLTAGEGDTCQTTLPVPSSPQNNATVDARPAVSSLLVNGSATPKIVQGTASVTLTATASDTQSYITAGEYFIGVEGDEGTGTAMNADDGPFNDELEEELTVTIDTSTWVAGTYTIRVDARNAAGLWGPKTAASIQVTVETMTAGLE